MSKLTGSKKATQFTESVIREMTRLNQLYGGVNLSQGFPDFPAPAAIKEAACAAINADVNQYAVTWGARPLREAIAREFTRRYGLEVVADEQVTVCCGSTEAMMSTMMAIIDPGDEVVIFEPFYENYGPDAILSGATPRYVTLHEPDPSAPSDSLRAGWSFDPDELAAAFNDKTKAIIINTPNNPTGKVFSRDELEMIAALCRKWDAIAISDEIYEHIIYDGRRHIPIATHRGHGGSHGHDQRPVEDLQRDRLARRLDDLAAVADRRDPQGARFPDRRRAGAAAGGGRGGARLRRTTTTRRSRRTTSARRDVLLDILERHHFTCYKPSGAYYIMTDISAFGFADDVEFARYLVKDVGVAAVPGSSFYKTARGPHQAAVLFLQEGRDAGGGRPPAGEARAGRRDASLKSRT